MRNHSNTQLPNAPPLTSTHWQTSTLHSRCHALHAQAFYTRLVFPLPLTIRPRQENSLYSPDPHQHSPKTTDPSRYLCVTSTRDAQTLSACKHCCAGSCIPSSTQRARLTLLQAPNLTLELKSSAASAATQRGHRCNSLLLRHPKRQMHAHLGSCHEVNGMAYTAPLPPSCIDECADVKEHGCAGPSQPTAGTMLVIVPGELASSYNDSLPSALVARCTMCSTTQRASSNPRKTRRKTLLRLKCFPSTDAHRSPTQLARLLLGCRALFQTVQLQPIIYDIQR